MAGFTAAMAVSAALVAPPTVSARPPEPKIVYLTFDDGPDGWNDPRLLRILRREHVPATFFVLGQAIARNRSAVKGLYLAGHAIGNHSYTHADLSRLSLPAIDRELSATQRALGPMGGRCFRPPYGAVSPAVTAAARAQGLSVVLWTVDPEDWAHQNTPYIVNHVLTHVRDRSVVLMHDGGGNRAASVNAVKYLIPQLRARGYEFRTVPACRVPLKGQSAGMAQKVTPKPKPTPTPVPTPTPTVTPTSTPTVTPTSTPVVTP